MNYTYLDSPTGPLLLAGDEEGLSLIHFCDGTIPRKPDPEWQQDARPFVEAMAQLNAYFAGELLDFQLRLNPRGTPFQLGVWKALCQIPYGHTISYGELARRIGKPSASRAVGLANGANPIAIVIPCHRVIGSNGKLTGYGGGLSNKRRLLDLERSHSGVMLPGLT